ncbi:MAG: 50S ribosomal protein L18 [Bacteroidales bacterium]|jgi:large subunit ribosomal protein L18|nr:50S ribosomal protein L18 [Bacteroidales bacterium]MDI9592734.1 50S ribosomal protein L18 [Bacteroidota bacterium]OQC37229.1 MAG: 50S ribosomal protein L18 [Bacteroidetes bacterium ADurb.Bin041]MBP7873733.1 50S ribosomal protein L18 [Bacteroidales bacterium]MCO6468010.1 50S ribosomal protein L18 [Bacteroidales bacterium]
MTIKDKKKFRRNRIKMRIRKRIIGSSTKPRMTVFRSNKEIYIQLIDDLNQKTLVSASSLGKDFEKEKMTKMEQAKRVGALIAQKAADAGIETVVFDRNGYLYHGRVKTLADAAREAGLKF